MGVDLKLLPAANRRSPWYAFDVLCLNRDSELFAAIRDLECQALCEPLRCHLAHDKDGETCYGTVEESPYGDPLDVLLAGVLCEVVPFVRDGDWQNRAVFAYLRELPKDWPVFLYWC